MRLFTQLAAILLVFQVFAQTTSTEVKTLTINDAIRGYHLYPSRVNQLQWVKDKNAFSRVVTGREEGRSLLIQEIDKTHLGTSVSVTAADIAGSGVEGLTRLPYAQWIGPSEIRFHHGGAYYTFNTQTKKSTKIMDSETGGFQFSPVAKGSNTSYVRIVDNGIEGKLNGNEFDATSDDEGVVIGQTVHRSEFGITNGLFWAPDGDHLAYYYKDESMVTEYPLYQLNDTPATANMLRYPTAGSKSHHVKVIVQHPDGKKVTMKVTGDKEQFLTNVSWTPDSKHVLIAVVNRAQNHMWLNRYNAQTGAFEKTLFEETNDRYVEPEHPAMFLDSDPSKFIWWSERDGYNHLYLYSAEGKLIRQLTKGNYVVTQLHGFSKDGTKMFITSTEETPLERHLYCVDFKSGKTKRLTNEAGYHSISANHDCSYFIDSYSSIKVPSKIQVIDADGALFDNIHSAPHPMKNYEMANIELGKIKGKGGHDLYYRVVKPTNFDPKKKYPVVVYLYNGPHLQLVTNRWMGGTNLWYQYMAEHGYVVYSIDGRGSADRGFEFESSVHRQMGTLEMEDQLSGVEWLKKQSYVDPDRIGIHGWSYGGFMTTSLMTREPGVYKVGVAGGPVIDWTLYEIMYTERYMDTPQENPEGYKNNNLLNHADKLEGKLLMIHGGQDDVVLWQHSLKYVQQSIQKGVQLDYFVYPHHKHNVYGIDRVHLYEKVSNYFFDNL